MKGLEKSSMETFDMRMITQIYFACCNLAATGVNYASLLVSGSQVLASMLEIILKCKLVPNETLMHISWFTALVSKSELT